MTFTILDVYKGGVPRGQWFRSVLTVFQNGQTSALTVSPATSPENWALLIDALHYQLNTPVMSGTGTGMLKVQNPDYVGVNLTTYEFIDNHLSDFPDEVIASTSADLSMIIRFKPPILLRGSGTQKDLTIGLGDNRDITSGDISFLVTGWTIKEEDYD